MPLSHATTLARTDFLILLGLTIVTFGIYARVIGHQFITFDDPAYIRDNPMVNRGITGAGIVWAFTTFYEANWHPLTWIAHMIDSQFFGANAGGHLFVNALIHVANTLLIFWFLVRTTRTRWPSALIAALFALHPSHVESVAWAAERKDTLCTFFGLLSLIAYTRYAKVPSVRRYTWTAVTLTLGLLAKPMLVTWPFVMLLLDYWPLRRLSQPISQKTFFVSIAPLVREKLPLFALIAASAVITSIAQSHGGAVRTFTEIPITMRLANALVAYTKYVLLTFWPNDLAVYYPFTPVSVWQMIAAAFFLVGVTAFCFFQWKSRPYLIVGWLWFMGTLVPVIGLVQVGGQSIADRYSYIPSIGLFIAVVFGLTDIANTRHVARSLRAVVASGMLLVLGGLTNAQILRWRDSFSLFKHTLRVTPPNLSAEYSLGLALGESGRLDEAAAQFEKVLHFQPESYDSLLNMGAARYHQGRFPEAIEYFQSATRVRPDAVKAHVQLGLALLEQNQNEAACEEMRRASQLAPQDPGIRSDFGLALERSGKIPEAVDQFHEALRLDPNNAEAHNNLGSALLASGDLRGSIPEFEAALRLKPELKVASDNLRQAQAQLNSQRELISQ